MKRRPRKRFNRAEYEANLAPEWRVWRAAIFARDHHTCVMCWKARSHNRRTKYDPHHILRKADRPDLMYDVNNGVTLCRPCHRKTFRKEAQFAPQFVRYIASLRVMRSELVTVNIYARTIASS